MHALRGQGELRGISISPFAPLTPTPLKTSRDTLHPETGGYVSDYCPAGHVRGMGLRGMPPAGGNSFRFAALSTSLKEGGNERF